MIRANWVVFFRGSSWVDSGNFCKARMPYHVSFPFLSSTLTPPRKLVNLYVAYPVSSFVYNGMSLLTLRYLITLSFCDLSFPILFFTSSSGNGNTYIKAIVQRMHKSKTSTLLIVGENIALISQSIPFLSFLFHSLRKLQKRKNGNNQKYL